MSIPIIQTRLHFLNVLVFPIDSKLRLNLLPERENTIKRFMRDGQSGHCTKMRRKCQSSCWNISYVSL